MKPSCKVLLVTSGVLLLATYCCGDDSTTSAMVTDRNMMPSKDEMMGAGAVTVKPMVMNPMKIGDMCQKDMDCTKNMGDGAQCKDMKCACKSNYKPTSDMMKCKSGANFAFVSTTLLIMALISKFLL